MLPGNINDRIAVFANKHEGFEGYLFSKTGQIGGVKAEILKAESRKQKFNKPETGNWKPELAGTV